MTREATVVLEDGKLMAEVLRTEACAKCHACQHGMQQRRLYALPKGDYKAGDKVAIELPDNTAFQASAIAYGVPLVCLMAGLFIGFALGLPDVWQALCALLGLAGGYAAIRVIDKRLRKTRRFEHRVCPVADRQPHS